MKWKMGVLTILLAVCLVGCGTATKENDSALEQPTATPMAEAVVTEEPEPTTAPTASAAAISAIAIPMGIILQTSL